MRRALLFLLAMVASGAAWAAEPYSGPYIGLHAGYGIGKAEQRQTNGGMPFGPFDYDVQGAIGGVTVGYSQQFDRVVAGIELEGGWMDVSGDGRIASSVPTKYQRIWTDGGLYGLVAGRLGLVMDRTLFYGKAGYALLDGEAGQKTTNPGYQTFLSHDWHGWAYGGGIEHQIANRFSVKIEYLRYDFGTIDDGYQMSISDPPIGFKYRNSTDLVVDTVKVGVAVRF